MTGWDQSLGSQFAQQRAHALGGICCEPSIELDEVLRRLLEIREIAEEWRRANVNAGLAGQIDSNEAMAAVRKRPGLEEQHRVGRPRLLERCACLRLVVLDRPEVETRFELALRLS